ncbi:MAG: ISL3 family transposase [Ktedonobacteraceae bacterium]
MSDLDTAALLFSLPDGICISLVRTSLTELVLHIACRRTCALCPLCQQPSERVHGHYGRTVADLPCAGRRVILALTVRKFVCGIPSCPRKIFTERLPDLVQSYARMTNWLREALVALGLATSAEVSERLAPSLGMPIPAPTLLRRLRAVACPPPKSVRILGVDDWAWKKGQTYGTILVDLEKRCPIELLPDRKEETLTAWLLTHPEIDVISRDRGGEYAAAAKKDAPQAQQIADKFHVVKNLRDGLKELMARKQRVLPEVEEASSDGIPLRAQGKRPASALSEGPKPDEPEKQWRSMSNEPRHIAASSEHSSGAPSGNQVSRANRRARYEAVRALHQQAISAREIARRLHMSRRTVQKFLVAESFPERSTPPYRGSILDPYKPYILDRRIGWLLEWLPALYGSQRARLHRRRGPVSSLHFQRAQPPSGNRNLGEARTICRWCQSQWTHRSSFQTLHQTPPVPSTSLLAVCEPSCQAGREATPAGRTNPRGSW